MASTHDGNETHDNHSGEMEMIGLAGIVALLLLVFAIGYMVVYPNHAEAGYSALYWNQIPRVSVEDDSRVIIFSAELESHELSVSKYTMKAYVEDKLSTLELVDLNANKKEEITFTITIPDSWSGQKKIRVTAQRVSDSNTQKAAPILEIVDWVTLTP